MTGWCGCCFRTFRVVGALFVVLSLLLNVTLILVSNDELSMSSWDAVTSEEDLLMGGAPVNDGGD